MILSDEDFVNIDGLDDILNDLKKNYNNNVTHAEHLLNT